MAPSSLLSELWKQTISKFISSSCRMPQPNCHRTQRPCRGWRRHWKSPSVTIPQRKAGLRAYRAMEVQQHTAELWGRRQEQGQGRLSQPWLQRIPHAVHHNGDSSSLTQTSSLGRLLQDHCQQGKWRKVWSGKMLERWRREVKRWRMGLLYLSSSAPESRNTEQLK